MGNAFASRDERNASALETPPVSISACLPARMMGALSEVHTSKLAFPDWMRDAPPNVGRGPRLMGGCIRRFGWPWSSLLVRATVRVGVPEPRSDPATPPWMTMRTGSILLVSCWLIRPDDVLRRKLLQYCNRLASLMLRENDRADHMFHSKGKPLRRD